MDDIRVPLVKQPGDSQILDAPVSWPGYTTYTSKNCCCCTESRLTERNVVFWNHWEKKLLFPILVLLIISSNYGCMIYLSLTFSLTTRIIIGIVITVLFLVYTLCYIRILSIGPGYFPFYSYAVDTDTLPPTNDNTVNGYEDTIAGVVTNLDQYYFAYLNQKPPRSILSRTARRIVIRPDHYCVWTASWIGKRNHKIFIQFLMYGFIYCLALFISSMVVFVLSLRKNSIATIILSLVVMFVTLAFGIWQGVMLLTQIQNIRRGNTNWENWTKKDTSIYNTNPLQNARDVFGDYSLINLLCPTSPFKNISNIDLVKDYVCYP